MLHNDKGHAAAVPQSPDESDHLRNLLQVHPRHRLIEKEELGSAAQAYRHLKCLGVSMRQIVRKLFLPAAQAHLLQNLVRPFGDPSPSPLSSTY